jgi:prepilin-type N-terminal cleavage/methylation domain-containing protein
MDKRGFTLIEMIIVMAIISILSYMIMPSIASSLQMGNNSADESNLLVLNSTTSFLRSTLTGSDPFEDATKSSEELMTVLVNKKLLPNKLKPLTAGKKFAWFREHGKWDYDDAILGDSDDEEDDEDDDEVITNPNEDIDSPVTGPQVWDSKNKYKTNDEVIYNGTTYVARKDTTSTPGTEEGDWQEITPDYRPFNHYGLGDIVKYNGKEFRSRASFTFNELPGLVSSPWQEITNEWRNFNVYNVGDVVVYDGSSYEAKVLRGAGSDKDPTSPRYWRKLK